jgi:hypothetical protein
MIIKSVAWTLRTARAKFRGSGQHSVRLLHPGLPLLDSLAESGFYGGLVAPGSVTGLTLASWSKNLHLLLHPGYCCWTPFRESSGY